MASLLDRVLHKHKAKTTAELVARTGAALEKCRIDGSAGSGGVPRTASGSGDGWLAAQGGGMPPSPASEKWMDEVGRLLGAMKVALFGDGDAVVPSKETALALAVDACAAGLPERLIDALPGLEFEARKDAAQVVGAIFRLDAATDPSAPGSLYLASHPHLLGKLVSDYASPTIALNAGSVLRDALRVPHCAAAFLSDADLVGRLLGAVEAPNFEVASDAFATLRDLLTRHKETVAAVFLEARYDAFCTAFAALTSSPNYVTRRQSVRLLGEVLLDRAYSATLIRYVADEDHLKAAMVLLKDSSPAIQFEAFHVFKAFVANPAKPPGVAALLAGNRAKLLKHLADFHVDKEDEQFREEKAVVVREISRLADPGDESGGGEEGAGSVQ